jgi:hypothetical protein
MMAEFLDRVAHFSTCLKLILQIAFQVSTIQFNKAIRGSKWLTLLIILVLKTLFNALLDSSP